MVEAERGANHHRQGRWIQSRVYGWTVFGYSYHAVCFSVIRILASVEARRNLSARVNNTQIRHARCVRMRYKRGFGRSASVGTSKIIKTDKRGTRVDVRQQLGADL